MNDIKKFKDSYKSQKRICSRIKDGTYSYEYLIGKLGAEVSTKYKTIEDFEEYFKYNVRLCEATVYMFYNLNGSISEREFEKFYKKFANASDEDKGLYEKANGKSYGELSEFLNKIKAKLDNDQDKLYREVRRGIDKINREIDERKKLKQELVDLGIAEDDGIWNVIVIKPERFPDYLDYLGKHSKKRR